jgi:hypothetical protein
LSHGKVVLVKKKIESEKVYNELKSEIAEVAKRTLFVSSLLDRV